MDKEGGEFQYRHFEIVSDFNQKCEFNAKELKKMAKVFKTEDFAFFSNVRTAV